MADKKKLQKISAELKKASQMHAAQAKKIDNISKGPSMLGIMPNITGNLNNNLKVQQLGANLFEGEALAGQEMAKRNLGKPVMPPSPDPIGDQYGMQFNQPFAQKKIVKNPVPQPPRIETEQIPQVYTKPTKKIYKEMTERLVKEVPKRMTGLMVEHPVRVPEKKMEKVREMPRKVIKRVNMEGPLAQTEKVFKDAGRFMRPKPKYRMPLEGVQDLQDMGAVKEDKKGQYVVNENATSVSDTLRFPKGTKHYSGKPYKTGQLIDESDYEDIIKKVNKS